MQFIEINRIVQTYHPIRQNNVAKTTFTEHCSVKVARYPVLATRLMPHFLNARVTGLIGTPAMATRGISDYFHRVKSYNVNCDISVSIECVVKVSDR